jgi:NhaP-type Na+/H+ or K+/H+ antiporter
VPDTLTSLALIPVAGVTASWVAWRLHIPGILALLAAGLVLGPWLGWLDPDTLFGDLLAPLVSLAVGLILFEGGLSLTRAELRESGSVVGLLLTVGVGITFALAVVLGMNLLGLPGDVASVTAAVLVVTGPTVVGPLLATIRPRGRIAAVLKCEGILVDPLGAVLAALVYQIAFVQDDGSPIIEIVAGLARFAATGAAVGLAGALLATFLLRRYLVPDGLITTGGLALAVGGFAAANAITDESGLLATTLMGIAIAAQRRQEVHDLLVFNESLRTLLIAALFVVLGARVTTDELERIGWKTFVFVAALILVARPLAVLVCSWRSALSARERVLAGWMAPRGIVAAAVSSVFALRLQGSGEQDAEAIVPTVFLTVLVTIAVYGLTAPPLAKRLGLSDTGAQGLLILGAGPLAIALGRAVQAEGFRVVLADTDADDIAEASAAGLETYLGTILSEEALAELDLHGLGRMLACTANREAAALAALHFGRTFGRRNVYMVPVTHHAAGGHETVSDLRARPLATGDLGVVELTASLGQGGRVSVERASPDRPPARELPLFVVTPGHHLVLSAADGPAHISAADRVVSFVLP